MKEEVAHTRGNDSVGVSVVFEGMLDEDAEDAVAVERDAAPEVVRIVSIRAAGSASILLDVAGGVISGVLGPVVVVSSGSEKNIGSGDV